MSEKFKIKFNANKELIEFNAGRDGAFIIENVVKQINGGSLVTFDNDDEDADNTPDLIGYWDNRVQIAVGNNADAASNETQLEGSFPPESIYLIGSKHFSIFSASDQFLKTNRNIKNVIFKDVIVNSKRGDKINTLEACFVRGHAPSAWIPLTDKTGNSLDLKTADEAILRESINDASDRSKRPQRLKKCNDVTNQ